MMPISTERYEELRQAGLSHDEAAWRLVDDAEAHIGVAWYRQHERPAVEARLRIMRAEMPVTKSRFAALVDTRLTLLREAILEDWEADVNARYPA